MRKIRRRRVLLQLELCRGPTFTVESKNWITFHLWETKPERQAVYFGEVDCDRNMIYQPPPNDD
jgi:hypothetical protein